MSKKEILKRIRGFRDIYGIDILYWGKLEEKIKTISSLFNIKEIRLPILEDTSVFVRGVGVSTDIVEKEMFTFTDRDSINSKGMSLSLRPEGTAGLVRAYIENNFFNPQSLKRFYYLGPMFRRERPQKGRYRQFYQYGVEYLGSSSPLADVEVINAGYLILKEVGLGDFVKLEINSVGCPVCRPTYNEKLLSYLSDYRDSLCKDCVRRMTVNPLRILDCKEKTCKDIISSAPLMINNLCEDCSSHFAEVRKYLTIHNINFIVNPLMVRGLDYYEKTAFEFVTDNLGSASAVCSGGRYNGLAETLNGPSTPGVGFGLGMDRVVELLKLKDELDSHICQPVGPLAFIISFGGKTFEYALQIQENLRSLGISAMMDYDTINIKKQMQLANRFNAKYAVIVGDDELSRNECTLKNLETGEQLDVAIENLYECLNK